MSRKVFFVAVLITSCFVSYILGSVINRKIMLSSFSEQFNRANATVNLGRYSEYRDIAVDIQERRYEDAKCFAELGASAMYDDLKSCLASKDCGEAVKQKIHEVAPEVLGETPLKFSYIKSKNGIKSCK